MNRVLEVCKEFNHLAIEIDDPLYKWWLKPAFCRDLREITGYPSEFVSKVVDLIYLGDNI